MTTTDRRQRPSLFLPFPVTAPSLSFFFLSGRRSRRSGSPFLLLSAQGQAGFSFPFFLFFSLIRLRVKEEAEGHPPPPFSLLQITAALPIFFFPLRPVIFAARVYSRKEELELIQDVYTSPFPPFSPLRLLPPFLFPATLISHDSGTKKVVDAGRTAYGSASFPLFRSKRPHRRMPPSFFLFFFLSQKPKR